VSKNILQLAKELHVHVNELVLWNEDCYPGMRANRSCFISSFSTLVLPPRQQLAITDASSTLEMTVLHFDKGDEVDHQVFLLCETVVVGIRDPPTDVS
jgi:hypothetical protein